MVLDYIPCDVEKFKEYYDEYQEMKNIPKDDEVIFFDMLDKRFCRYIIKKGKYKNHLCMRKFSKYIENEIYCHTHRYQEKKCYVNNCKNKCKKGKNKCNKHYKEYRVKIETVEEYTNDINYHFKIDFFMYYYPKINIFDIKIKDNIKKSDTFSSEKKDLKMICYHNEKKNISNKHNNILSFDTKKTVPDKYNSEKSEIVEHVLLENENKNENKDFYNTYNNINTEVIDHIGLYLCNMNYILETTNSIVLLKRSLFNILEILFNILTIKNCNEYLELADYNNFNNKKYHEIILYEHKNYYFNINIYTYIWYSYYEKIRIFWIKTGLNIFKNEFYIYKKLNEKLLTTNKKNTKKISPERKKRKKELNNFNKKYKLLTDINKKYADWARINLSTDFYIDRIINIIEENMEHLNEKTNKYGKSMETLRNIYTYIGTQLYDAWELIEPKDNIEKHDLKLIYKQEWKEYDIFKN